jgi:hypothetical protein
LDVAAESEVSRTCGHNIIVPVVCRIPEAISATAVPDVGCVGGWGEYADRKKGKSCDEERESPVLYGGWHKKDNIIYYIKAVLSMDIWVF